jgi:DNA-binding NarL/FixJ family response regulator
MTKAYSVLIVEDEPIIAQDIAECLEQNGFVVTGIASDGPMALQSVKETQPDAAIVDIRLEGEMDGIEFARKLMELSSIPFVFLTSHSDRDTIDRAKQTFPAGYLLKPFNPVSLMASLEVALFNHIHQIKSSDKRFSLDWLNNKIPTPLTQREFEVLAHLRNGKSNKDICDLMSVSLSTVKTHFQHLFDKMDVRNRTEILFKLREILEEA